MNQDERDNGKMKVVMVISQFWPLIGGAEKQAQLLSSTLNKKGVEVRIVTGWWKVGTPRKEMIDGVSVFRNFTFWGMFGIKGIRTFGALFYMISLSTYLLLHRRDYDIIHVHQVLYPAFMAVLVGKCLLKKPVVVKYACSGVASDIRQMRRFPLGRLQLEYVIRGLDCLVATNQEGIFEIEAEGCPRERVKHIPNGVCCLLGRRTERNEKIDVITTVRLDKQKGIDILLEAWSVVVTQERNLNLLILGKGPLEKDLKRMAKSLNIDDSVGFLGLINKPEEYLRESDIFVLPSRAEGMSNALLEAMCIGLSCIATNISGNMELISDKENEVVPIGGCLVRDRGVLVNPDDVKGLAEAILYLIRNEKAREELGERARKFIQENYSIDMIADKYIALYQRILNKESQCAESVER